MKKILFTLMILLGISAFSSNSYETDLVGRMKVLEEKVQTKLDSGVTADMREATTELSETWENELNTVYSLLMEKLPKAEKVKLENEQKKWLKNRNIKAKKDAKEAEGGTMEPLLFASSIKDLNEARAIELAKRYDEIVNKK
ncbi:lysozyme inhibitor LprI family protein [Fusobacterium animalis]|uniref:lysozyme inhibitor LprI family protein n=1 Tax=Fusobacterium animalis TaxID=76859 RepID=UPI00355630E5